MKAKAAADKLTKKEAEEEEKQPTTEELLTEIRDLLAEKSTPQKDE